MNDTYQERVLNSPAVCVNCFATVRVERADPTRGGLTREFESHYERDRRQTSVEYGPAERASQSKGVFCECGVEGSFDRVWADDGTGGRAALPDDTTITDDGVDRERFKTFVQNLLRSLTRQGLALDRQRVAARALSGYDRGADVDEALAAGVGAGLSSRSTTRTARARSA